MKKYYEYNYLIELFLNRNLKVYLSHICYHNLTHFTASATKPCGLLI